MDNQNQINIDESKKNKKRWKAGKHLQGDDPTRMSYQVINEISVSPPDNSRSLTPDTVTSSYD